MREYIYLFFESFLELLETFPEQIKLLQSICNINVCLKAAFHKRINSYCLESFPEFLETFHIYLNININNLFIILDCFNMFFKEQLFCCAF